MGLEKLQYTAEITLTGIPKQWIPQFQLYYPDLPQFPIVYVHIVTNSTRVYGFPVSLSFDIISDNECNVKLLFMCNKDLDNNHKLKEIVKNELEERFGIKDKIGLNNVLACCNKNKSYESFFKDLWHYISRLYGEYIPYGKFYEEVYSIVRFVSAWQPKTGRQSEMRMLYNFLSTFGENIEIATEWNHLEFFLLPTYEDILKNNLKDFPKFETLYSAMERIWNICFTETTMIGGMIIRSMKGAWPQDKDTFIKKVALPLEKNNKISSTQRHQLERLVDAFNRHSWRAAFFIWSILGIKALDYKKWDKRCFVNFYLNKNGVGVSEKVVACFIQQGFKNEEVIPIDIWVGTFHIAPLAIEEKGKFLNMFSSLGKLERAIWLSSQAKKTNITTFFNLLWCLRYGDTGNNELRMPNPIACYECSLKKNCPGLSMISNKKVLVKDGGGVKIDLLLTKKGRLKGKVLVTKKIKAEAKINNCSFICLTTNNIPKKIFVPRSGDEWKLIDEFSGYILDTQTTNKVNSIITVSDFIKSLPPFPA
ncbi:hypothetical protein ACFL4C_01415 [Candidatus Omnitrophota bacterium]